MRRRNLLKKAGAVGLVLSSGTAVAQASTEQRDAELQQFAGQNVKIVDEETLEAGTDGECPCQAYCCSECTYKCAGCCCADSSC